MGGCLGVAVAVGASAALSGAEVAVAEEDGSEAVVDAAWLAGSEAVERAVAAGCDGAIDGGVTESGSGAVVVVAGGSRASVVAAMADARCLACVAVVAFGAACEGSDVGDDEAAVCDVAVVDAGCGIGSAAGVYDAVEAADSAEMRACVGAVADAADSGATGIGLDTAVAVVGVAEPSRG